MAEHLPGRKVLLPDPTWGNHQALLKRARLEQGVYRYFSAATLGLDYEGMLADLRAAAPGSIVLLHACAHNPTGVDPSPEQWKGILEVCMEKSLIAWFDSAYLGFASGSVERDRASVELFANAGLEIFISQSFAKNFGLYGERVGASHVICANAEFAKAVKSQLELIVRPMYSNPPAYGARIVATVLNTPELLADWLRDIATMSNRITAMRQALVNELKALKTPGDWSHITNQIGMFAYTGLNEPQVERLIGEFHIYLLKSGRISMAGVNSGNVAYLARAINAVVTGAKANL